MKSPHAVLQLLRDHREYAATKMVGTQGFGVAVCEVLDELIRRAQVVADEYPVDETMTLRLITEMPTVMEVLSALLDTANALNKLTAECAGAVSARRDPVLRFVDRVESEGFAVAEDWTITDTRAWPNLEEITDPDLRIELEAAKIARAERVRAYHERAVRMAAAFEETISSYTQQARDLIGTLGS